MKELVKPIKEVQSSNVEGYCENNQGCGYHSGYCDSHGWCSGNSYSADTDNSDILF
jgi:hypothetical protein